MALSITKMNMMAPWLMVTGDPRQVIADGLGFDFEVDFNEHGNLYTWEEALAACPEGWRLPTDEDWQNLETTRYVRCNCRLERMERQGSYHPCSAKKKEPV